MKEIVVLSGKGGAGKTSITAAMFALTPNALAVDADVDAADLALLIGGSRIHGEIYLGRQVAVLAPESCRNCGRCAKVCAFGAIVMEQGLPKVDPAACEGCGACVQVCPTQVLRMQRIATGTWEHRATQWGRLVHARLFPGEENSGRFVAFLREEGRRTAKALGADWIWTDGPPGIGCAAISSLSGADKVLLVVAPGASGLHDAARVLELARQFGISVDVVGNRSSHEDAEDVQELARQAGARFLGAIPRDQAFVEAEFSAMPVLDLASPELRKRLGALCEEVKETMY